MENQFYFEFDEHEYYALVSVKVDKYDLKTKPHKKAAEIYVENVGGESVDEVLNEAFPNLRTKEFAFMKFAYTPTLENETLQKVKSDFETIDNGVLLIDGSLL